jgi:hypothetical protein
VRQARDSASFPTVIGLPTFREDVTAAIPQLPQQGANRATTHERVIRATPNKEQELAFPVTNRSTMSRLLGVNPDQRRSFGSNTCPAGEETERYNLNGSTTVTDTGNRGSEENKINFKAEGWAPAGHHLLSPPPIWHLWWCQGQTPHTGKPCFVS